MTDQFIFFCTNVGNELLLKREIATFYPELTISYSRKGFLTYKNKGVLYGLNTIAQLEPTFATRCGICLGKSHSENVLELINNGIKKLKIDGEKVAFHNYSINTHYQLDLENLISQEINKPALINKTVFNLISLGEGEVWLGVHRAGQSTTKYPNAETNIKMPDDSPSRGYLKFAQIIKLFNIKFDRRDKWIDFGSAPGGVSQYLLEQGCQVLGVDTAKMDASVENHLNYKFIQSAVQDLSQEKLPFKDVNWVNADLNLNPNQAVKEVLRLCKKYNHSLKGIIVTMQMTNLDYVDDIETFEDVFYDWGFHHIVSRQVPAHKKEYVIIARR